MTLDDRSAEGRQVRVRQVVRSGVDVEAVAFRLGAAVHRVMFRRGDQLQILRVVALQSGHKGDAELGDKKRVFAISLLPAPPGEDRERC